MAYSRSEYWVGTIIVIAVVGCVIMMFKVGNLENLLRSENRYTIIFKNVHGLKEGDPVRYAGVDVGKVVAVEVQPGTDNYPAKALVSVEVDSDYTITDESEAKIKESLTGITSVEINPKLGSVLKDGDQIKGKDTPTLGDITERADQLLSKEQLKKIQNIVANTDETIKSLKETAQNINDRLTQEDGDINGIILDLKAATSETRKFVEQNRKKLNQLVSDTASTASKIKKLVEDNDEKISSIIENINTASKSAPEITENINETIEKVKVLVDKAEKAIDSANGMLDENKEDVRTIIRNLKDTSDYLAALGEDLTRRPWRLLNPPKSKDMQVESVYLLNQELSKTVDKLSQVGQSMQKLADALETQDSEGKKSLLNLVAKFGKVLDELQHAIKRQNRTFEKIDFDKK